MKFHDVQRIEFEGPNLVSRRMAGLTALFLPRYQNGWPVPEIPPAGTTAFLLPAMAFIGRKWTKT